MDCSTPGPPLHHQLPEFTQNSCPSSWWCHPTISSSVIPFSCLQSFPASESFPMSQFFASCGQSIGVSASVLPMNIQDWFPLGLTSLISLQSKGLSRVFSSSLKNWKQNCHTTQQSHCWRIHTEYTIIERNTCTPVFITALFTIGKTWKQPRCPLADKRIRKLWYIYTMEYHSAIKRNTFESVLMRWMKLEPIIQSEVSQEKKKKTNTNTVY